MLYEAAYPFLLVGAKARQMEKRVHARLGRAPKALRHVTYNPESFYRVACWRLRKMDIEMMMRVAPMRAARLSIERFEKTKRQALRETRTGKKAAQIARHNTLKYQGKDVHYFSYGPANGPKILALHGWNGRATMLAQMAVALAERGFHVIVPDLPGHGLSAGDRYSFYDLGQACKEIFEPFGEFQAVIGHSAGGLFGMLALSRGLNAKNLVTIGAPSSLSALLHSYIKITQMPESSLPLVLRYYTKRYGQSPTEVGPQMIANLPVRTLVIHEESDWQVGPENAREIHGLAPNSTLLMTKGQTHMNVQNAGQVQDAITDFLRSETAYA